MTISVNSAGTLSSEITGNTDDGDAPSRPLLARAPSFKLPENPVVTIVPSTSHVSIDFADLWTYRELLYFLTWRDIKVRYKQTGLGIAWAILQPLLTMLIFAVLFGRLAGVPSEGFPYPLFAYAGLLPWTFFANAVGTSSNSLVGSAHLITKVYFPRMIVPGASVAAGLLDFALAFVVLIGLMIFYAVIPGWNLLMLPVLVLLLTLLTLGIGMWLSAVNVRYRDVRYVLPFVIQLWMYVTPIIYPVSFVPGKLRLLRYVLLLNPLTGIVENFRSALFSQPFKWTSLAITTAITLVMLVYSAYVFQRMEKTFADIV